MASIRKRGERWHVQVRRKDHPPICKVFSHRKDADAWVRDTERKLDRGEDIGPKPTGTVVRELLNRYADTVAPTKRGAEFERVRLHAMAKQSVGKVVAAKITTSALATWRDQRLLTVAPATVLREIGLLHRVLVTARHEWGEVVALDAFEFLGKPKAPPGRVRRVPTAAVDALMTEADASRNQYLKGALVIALETGMRRGEIVDLQWPAIDFDTSLIFVTHSKNGHGRTIPMTPKLQALLQQLRASGHKQPVDATGGAIHQSFEYARERARKALQERVEGGEGEECVRALHALHGLRFHDLRHEAISRFFEKGLTMVEAAEVSGHRTLAMLKRYAHADLQPIARKFAASTSI